MDRPAAGGRAAAPVVRAAARYSPAADADPLPGAADGRPDAGDHPAGADAGRRLGQAVAVVGSLTSVSARAMLGALIAGQSDPQVLGELAKGKMWRKIPVLTVVADRDAG